MKLFDEFIDIPGYEGLYQINRNGDVKSLRRFNPKSGRAGRLYKETIKKTYIDRYGYAKVTLCKDGMYHTVGIHRLLAMTFIPNKNNYISVNHKDENKLNNSIDNLEWCTIKYNNNYNNRQKRIAENRKKKVIRTNIKTNDTKIFDSVTEATNSVEGSKRYIIDCCKGIKLNYKGYKWRYYEIS